MGEERRAIERNWRIHKKEIEALLVSDTPVLTQRFYEDAVAGVAVDPRLRGQVGDLMRAIMKLRMIADCRTTGATPLEPADNGNLRVSVALECKHPEWTAPQDEGFAALSATERMERIVESVRRGADGPRTGISTSALKLEQQVKAGRKVWVVDQGRETNEALGSMVDGTLQTFDVPMKLASALLRAESIRVFESTPWERLPADGLARKEWRSWHSTQTTASRRRAFWRTGRLSASRRPKWSASSGLLQWTNVGPWCRRKTGWRKAAGVTGPFSRQA